MVRSRWISVCTLLLVLDFVESSNADAQDSQPNVVFILADDLGWSELGCYGNDFNETPHLDRLSQQGLRCTHAYAAAPVCSPYRAALLTGQYPARVGIVDYLRPDSPEALSEATVTLPEMLQRHGYTTGMIGKWHLTGYEYHGATRESRPADHGFDWDVGREIKSVGNGANFFPYVFRDQPVSWIDFDKAKLGADEYLIDRMNLEAVEFIRENHDRPFFLYLSHYGTHTILNGRPDLVEKYRQKHVPGVSSRERCYLCQDAGHEGDPLNHWAADHNPHLAAMLESIDDGMGMIDETLDELGLSENTIVIFTSDNGGETNVTSNAPLRGGKSQLYEGGIRVPLIIRWPEAIQAGRTSSQVTMNTDFYPTLLDASGIERHPSYKIDGNSMIRDWRDEEVVTRPRCYWHYPLEKPHFLGGRSAGAVRDGDWKLIEFFDDGHRELYNLLEDPGETKNVVREHPERVSALSSALHSWHRELGLSPIEK